jgi:glyoxylate reductase
MRELFDTQLNIDDRPMSPAALIEAVKVADVLVPTVTDRIDGTILAQAGEQLKLIASFSNGFDHIDVEKALARGITVTNTPGVLTEDTADMTMALILAVPRRLVEGARVLTPDHDWAGWSPTWMLGRRMAGKRLGIVGMGRIGQAVARRAKAFGLSIHYHNRNRLPTSIEEGLEATYWDSLDQMLARMDIISVNCPRTPGTFHLLSERRLKLLRPDAYVVNTSRGDVIDENALAKLLETARSPARGSTCSSMSRDGEPEAAAPRRQGQGRAAAAYGLGDDRGPHRHGREGPDQHPRLFRRPQAAGSSPARIEAEDGHAAGDGFGRRRL